jgi:hypothetical protein
MQNGNENMGLCEIDLFLINVPLFSPFIEMGKLVAKE